MQPELWGDLSGSIYYRTLILRGKSINTSPCGAARSAIRPIVKFRTKQTSRWNFRYEALSAGGKISFQVEANDAPMLGVPSYRGALQTEKGPMADIICSNESFQILSIRTKDTDHNITVERTGRRKESDIVFGEDSIGELARILRWGCAETYREQAAELIDLGLCRRGSFREAAPLQLPDHPVYQCLLAALCIYFYQLEPLYNAEGCFG